MVKRKSRAAVQEQQTYTTGQLVEVLLDAVPELRESLSQADMELAIEDRGWLTTGKLTGPDFNALTRKRIVERSRLFWFEDPLAKQAVRLWTTYCFGYGMSFEAADKGLQKQLMAFAGNRRNKTILSPAGQQRLSNKLLVDGEIFFAVFATDPVPSLRTIDPIQVTRIVTDPDDDERVLCYKRETPSDKTLYYADWALDDDGVPDAEKAEDPDLKGPIKLERDRAGKLVKVHHLAFEPMGKRGNGLLSCCVNWSREHRRFMEARVALTQALAKFAYKLTAKGGQAGLNALQQKLQSSLSQTGTTAGFEKNPPPAPAATWLQNSGIDLAPMPRGTGGGDAKEDGNSLKLMVCAGTGIMLHYFGDPSTGNLATATAMELPMLKQFAGYQELWKGAFRDLFSIVLDEGPDDEPAEIDIELPPILDEDLQKLSQFISAIVAAFPEAKVPEVLRPGLIAMGVENIDDVMDAIAKKREEIDAAPPPVPAPAGGPPAPQIGLNQESLAALNKFSEAVNGVLVA